MSIDPALQYTYRSLKSFSSTYGPPNYQPADGFPKLDGTIKIFQYSADGRYLAVALAESVSVYDGSSSTLLITLPVASVVDVIFSPLGGFIALWQRYVKPGEGEDPPRNLTVWSIQSTKLLTSFTQKAYENWSEQFPIIYIKRSPFVQASAIHLR